MEKFVVSARKYRPTTFKSVVGQDALTTTLKNAIKRNQLAQAYLFCGPRGVGKTTCARIFAKTINCFNVSEDNEACNQCESCVAFNEQRSFNIHELDAASNNSVDGIRSLIDQVRIPPQVGKYSVYIIDEVHMLSTQAFNAFLKTLEEPPAHAIFILATTEKHKIIPTILSRCQIYDFNRIKVEDTVKYLEYIAKEEKVSYEVEALNVIAQKADGAMRDALSIFDQVVSYSNDEVTYQKVIENLNILDYQYFFNLIENFLAADYATPLMVYDELLSKGFDPQQFISGLSDHFRNLLICKDPQTVTILEVGSAIASRYIEQATTCSPDFLIEGLDIINQADVGFRQSINQRLHIELMLIRLSALNLKKKNEASVEKTDSIDSLPTASVQTEKVQHVRATPVEEQPKPTEERKAPPVPQQAPKSFSIKSALAAQPEVKQDSNDEQSQVDEIIDDSIEETAVNQLVDNEDTQAESLDEETPPFGQEELELVWERFIKTFLLDKPRYGSLLQNYPPLLISYDTVKVVVEASLQEEMYKELQLELVNFIQEESGIKPMYLTVEVETSSSSSGEKLYTADDKFKYFTQLNPDIIKLKQQLHLDFE